MNLNIVANSAGFLLLGMGIMLGGVVAAAVLEAFWPLLFILLGLIFTVRLEKDPISIKLTELTKLGNVSVKRFDKQLYGIVGDHFIVAPYNMPALQNAEALLKQTSQEQSIDSSSRSGESAGESPATLPTRLHAWRISDISRVTFATNGNTFAIVQGNSESQQRFQHTSVRDMVLKRLKPAVEWKIDQEYRKIYQLNLPVALACLPVMFFAMALVFTAVGIIQPNQLPLNNWNDLKNIQGKARGIMTIWVALCESYLFLVNNLHASVGLLLGMAVTIAFAILLYAAQWTKVADTTWWHPAARTTES